MKSIRIINSVLVLVTVAVCVRAYDLDRAYVLRRFAQLSYNDPSTWIKNTWFGIPTQQNPNDIWIIQEIINETRPDLIIETGTLKGGSAVLWALILREVNPSGRVITIDIEDLTGPGRTHPLFKERVDFLLGSSVDPAIIQQVKDKAAGKKVMVLLDSLHTADHVLKEMELYGPLVPVGGYMLVQDTNINGNPVLSANGPGPNEAVEAYLKSHNDFERDYSRERMLFSHHPGGYLKKVR